MALMSPIGLILPEKLNGGDAWGEWDAEKLREMLGFVPKGLAKLSGLWSVPNYGFGEDSSHAVQYLAYIVSGLLGIVLAGLIVFLLSKMLLKRTQNEKRGK